MEPRLASRLPRACAGCYGQHPDRVHVDFATPIDGPVINVADPRVGRVDWVVLCEKCVRLAFELLPEQANERDTLRRERDLAVERRDKAENYASTLEDSLGNIRDARPEPREDAPPKTRRRRAAA